MSHISSAQCHLWLAANKLDSTGLDQWFLTSLHTGVTWVAFKNLGAQAALRPMTKNLWE